MHKLLQRQLKRFFGSMDSVPESLTPFLSLVDEAYCEAEQEHLLLERSLELTNQELLDKNRSLQKELNEHERAGEILLQTQASLRQVIDKSPYGIVVRRNQRWIYVNHAWARFLGYENPEDLLGKRGLDFLPAEELERYNSGQLEKGPGDVPVGQVRFQRRNREIILLEIAPAQEILFEGELAHLIVAQDITARKKMEAQLLLSDRMASLGLLAAGIAHEINNPLAGILGNLEFAETVLSDPVELQAVIQDAKECANRVRHIIRGMKTFSRPDEQSLTQVDVQQALESAIKLVQNEVRHRARLVKVFQPVPYVLANEARIGQVFLNLLVNAAQAIPEGNTSLNTITIYTYANPQGEVVIEIKDTGVGIAEENLAKIFDPFFTTKALGVGTGLGLSICHGIITSLKGRIEAESTLGSGCLFRITLPPTEPRPIIEETPMPVFRRRHRILVIDDEAPIGTAIRNILREHEVIPLRNANEALQRIKLGEHFDAILCDLMMPIITGMEFYAQLSQEAPELCRRVIFISGGAFTPQARTFLDEVPNTRLEKPFTTKELKQALSTFLL
jgi:two-component system cell cycle sensor histidine kinase/response regulator CckA